jgi:predicted transcriptional regulator
MQSTQTAKEEALQAIQQLPDNVDFEEIVYRLYVINKVHQGMTDVENGNTITHEELKREIEQW